jgi:hypothetical protein
MAARPLGCASSPRWPEMTSRIFAVLAAVMLVALGCLSPELPVRDVTVLRLLATANREAATILQDDGASRLEGATAGAPSRAPKSEGEALPVAGKDGEDVQPDAASNADSQRSDVPDGGGKADDRALSPAPRHRALAASPGLRAPHVAARDVLTDRLVQWPAGTETGARGWNGRSRSESRATANHRRDSTRAASVMRRAAPTCGPRRGAGIGRRTTAAAVGSRHHQSPMSLHHAASTRCVLRVTAVSSERRRSLSSSVSCVATAAAVAAGGWRRHRRRRCSVRVRPGGRSRLGPGWTSPAWAGMEFPPRAGHRAYAATADVSERSGGPARTCSNSTGGRIPQAECSRALL